MTTRKGTIAKVACLVAATVGTFGSTLALAAPVSEQGLTTKPTARPASVLPTAATDRFVTLGTAGGPDAQAGRSQPANILISGEHAYLIDAGDGAAGQLAKFGLPLSRVTGVFLSHLHFDHSAGLLGILALRFQMNVAKPLHLYGPPGTKDFVDGLLASMQAAARIEGRASGTGERKPADGVTVTELFDGDAISIAGASVRVRANTHYSALATGEKAVRSASLSFRFDLARRSIVYTGDTGPSKAVEQLSRGADLLVCEMIDVERFEERLRQFALPAAKFEELMAHMRNEHLTPEAVGELGRSAGVNAIVATHLVGFPAPGANDLSYVKRVRDRYAGEVLIARDLDSF